MTKMTVAFLKFANVPKRYATVTKLSFHSGNDSLIYSKLLVQMFKKKFLEPYAPMHGG
jgi:hypothetical protein